MAPSLHRSKQKTVAHWSHLFSLYQPLHTPPCPSLSLSLVLPKLPMDSLVESYYHSRNIHTKFQYHMILAAQVTQKHLNGYNPDQAHTQYPVHQIDPSPCIASSPPNSGNSSYGSGLDQDPTRSVLCSSDPILIPTGTSEGDFTLRPDYYENVLGYLNQMLMEEEDLQIKPCMLHESLALQAAEKSFYDALTNQSTSSECPFTPDKLSGESAHFVETQTENGSNYHSNPLCGSTHFSNLPLQSVDSSPANGLAPHGQNQGKVASLFQGYGLAIKDDVLAVVPNAEKKGKRKSNYVNDGDYEEDGRPNKQLAGKIEGAEETEIYDEALLCRELNPHLHNKPAVWSFSNKKKPAGRPRNKDKDSRKMIVDLMSLLTHCAQAITNGNSVSAHGLLKKIRQHSSVRGDSTERIAYHFANAIEDRLSGTGSNLQRAFKDGRMSAAESIKSYHEYMASCPFHKMSNILANKTIKRLSIGRERIHIIDFGISYGFQWPCYIQHLSLRPGGPPKLRITGIDFPQAGLRPAERVEGTGHRLANYCRRFNVPFEYIAIAKKWEHITIEELKIEPDEAVVVNCMYRLRNVSDEMGAGKSPRDQVLELIKKINCDLFVHGVINGNYNAPFFLTRFKESLFYYSTHFDMFENAWRGDDDDRLLFEEVLARDIKNLVACEGTSRVERPESYRQWQGRNTRAGFRQVGFDQDLVEEVRAKVKLNYHKDFIVDEDGKWILQGWKGRVLCALSLWKPCFGNARRWDRCLWCDLFFFLSFLRFLTFEFFNVLDN